MYKRLCLVCLLFCISGLSGCSGQNQSFTSPSGDIQIIVKYDFASRPTVYKKGWLFNKKIWSYEGPGFTETVYFEEEWVSENEFIFRYNDKTDAYDETYLISVE